MSPWDAGWSGKAKGSAKHSALPSVRVQNGISTAGRATTGALGAAHPANPKTQVSRTLTAPIMPRQHEQSVSCLATES